MSRFVVVVQNGDKTSELRWSADDDTFWRFDRNEGRQLSADELTDFTAWLRQQPALWSHHPRVVDMILAGHTNPFTEVLKCRWRGEVAREGR